MRSFGGGGPCVVKADVAGAVLKTDEGAVRLGITDVDTAASVYREFTERFGDRLDGVVVQSQVAAGLELSGRRHAGSGVRALRRRRCRRRGGRGPGRSRRARRSDHRRRSSRRGRRVASRTAVRRLPRPTRAGPSTRWSSWSLVIATLIAAVPEIHHVDLNPVIVGTTGCVVVDAACRRLVACLSDQSDTGPARLGHRRSTRAGWRRSFRRRGRRGLSTSSRRWPAGRDA